MTKTMNSNKFYHSTIKNLQASSYGETFKGENRYIKSILDPRLPAHIPDMTLAPTILKQIHFDETITVGAVKEYLVWWPYYNRSNPLLLFGKYETDGKYYWMRNLKPNEDLSENFCSGRPVSGRIDVFSDTISSGNFELGGTISGACVREAAPITDFDYLSLTSYSENESDCVLSKNLTSGVTALMKPTGENRFMPFETNAVSGTDFETDVEFVQEGQIPVGTAIYEFDLTKYNMMGKTKISMNMYTEIARTSCSIRLDYKKLASDGTISDVPTTRTWYGGTGSAFIQDTWYTPCPVSKMYIYVTPTSTSNFTFKVSVSNHNVYSNSATRPSTFMAVRGLSANQSVKITGVMNYEVVPDSELALNLKDDDKVGNPKDFYVAQYMLQHQKDFGIRFLSTRTEYEMMIKSNSDIVRRDGNLYAAAIDTLYPIAKAAGQFATPFVSTAANLMVPGSGAVTQGVGQFLFGGSPKNPIFGDLPKFSFSEALKQAVAIVCGDQIPARTYALYLANEFKKQLGTTPQEIPFSNENDLALQTNVQREMDLLLKINNILNGEMDESIHIEDLARIHRSLQLSKDPRIGKFEVKYRELVNKRGGLRECEKPSKSFRDLVLLYQGSLHASSNEDMVKLLQKFLQENNIGMDAFKSIVGGSAVPRDAVPVEINQGKNFFKKGKMTWELEDGETIVNVTNVTPARIMPSTNAMRDFIDGIRSASGRCNIVLWDPVTAKGVTGWIMMGSSYVSLDATGTRLIKKRVPGNNNLNIYCHGTTLSLCRRMAGVLQRWGFEGDVFVQTSFDDVIEGEIVDESIDIPFLLCSMGFDAPSSVYVTGATDIKTIMEADDVCIPIREVAKIEEKTLACAGGVLLYPGISSLDQLTTKTSYTYSSITELIGLQWVHRRNQIVDTSAIAESRKVILNYTGYLKGGTLVSLRGNATVAQMLEYLKKELMLTNEEINAYNNKTWSDKEVNGFTQLFQNKTRTKMFETEQYPLFLERTVVSTPETKKAANEFKMKNISDSVTFHQQIEEDDVAKDIKFAFVKEMNSYAKLVNTNDRVVKILAWIVKNHTLKNERLETAILDRMSAFKPSVFLTKGLVDNIARTAEVSLPGHLKREDIVRLIEKHIAALKNGKGKASAGAPPPIPPKPMSFATAGPSTLVPPPLPRRKSREQELLDITQNSGFEQQIAEAQFNKGKNKATIKLEEEENIIKTDKEENPDAYE